MIDHKQNPVEWALLMYEFGDLIEHLQNLEQKMNENGSIDETDYQIQISHIYAHLNRVWNSRNGITESTENDYEQECKFPTDIEPV